MEMAKGKEIDDEVKARQLKDEEERKQQEAEALLKRKERERKQKSKEKRQKAREEKERKRIRNIIDYPFKVVHNTAALISIAYFLIQFFGNSVEILESLYKSFILFLVADLGGCLLVFVIFYVISLKKEQQLKEQIRLNEEQIKIEEERRKREEQELLETQKVMLESNDDSLEAKRQEELRLFREMKENEMRTRPAERHNRAATDFDDPLSHLPDDLLENNTTDNLANGFNSLNDTLKPNELDLNFDENSDNPFITMPKK